MVGRDYFGVFPLRGKPLNVREAAHAQIMKNEEIQNIVKIMGLRYVFLISISPAPSALRSVHMWYF